GNSFRRNGPGDVTPFLPDVGQDISDFLIGQSFIPRLHHRGAEVTTLDSERALQSFEHNHRRPARSVDDVLRTSERRILTGDTKTIGLMTSRAVSQENFLTAFCRR